MKDGGGLVSSKQPKVSICIPTYGRADVLQHVIESVLKQTYSDFEVFISDDASPDNTADVVLGFKDRRIRYNRNDYNLGVRRNWNFIIKKAYGEYILKLDDDDYIHPEFIEKTVSLLDKNPNVASVYTGYYYTNDYNGGSICKVVDRMTFKGDYVRGIDFIKAYLLRSSIPGYHHSSAVFRYIIAKEIEFYEKVPNDIVFSLALAVKGDVGYVPKALFYYVQHNSSRATNFKEKFYTFDPTKIAKSFFELDFVEQNEELQKIKEAVYERERITRSALHLFISRRAFSLKEYIQITKELIKKDKRLLISPVFVVSLILTLLFPPKYSEKLIYMYKNKSLFRKINRFIFRPHS